jgi:hypothetical protein
MQIAFAWNSRLLEGKQVLAQTILFVDSGYAGKSLLSVRMVKTKEPFQKSKFLVPVKGHLCKKTFLRMTVSGLYVNFFLQSDKIES